MNGEVIVVRAENLRIGDYLWIGQTESYPITALNVSGARVGVWLSGGKTLDYFRFELISVTRTN